MDIINHYSVITPAGSAAADRTGAKAPDAKSASGGGFLDMVRGQGSGAEAQQKAELVRQLADGNSSFYAGMRTMLKARAEKSKEDQEEQAIIDALGAVLDALSGKKDVAGKKESVNKSASDLTKKIGERISKLKADDPERIKLESMLKRLREVGIYIDLSDTDDWWQSEDETFETLTQLLTRKQAEQVSAEHPKENEVNQTE